MTAESFLDGRVSLHCGDCLDVLDTLPENSVDGCVTDPPYPMPSMVKRFGSETAAEIKFGDDGAWMRQGNNAIGKASIYGDVALQPSTWAKLLRVLKPGAHALIFCNPVAIGGVQSALDAAGFDRRDCLIDVIDSDARIAAFVGSLSDEQRASFFRCVEDSNFGGLLAWIFGTGFPKNHRIAFDYEKRLCKQGDDNKFYYVADGEPMRRAAPFRHPLANDYADAGTHLKPAFEAIVMARKPLADGLSIAENVEAFGTGSLAIDAARIGADGNWPANILTDGSSRAISAFPAVANGTAARFFYSPKADGFDRLGSKHPTVKPVPLIQYCARMILRPGQIGIDPFAGTGTFGEAAFREGMRALLIERDCEFQADIRRRMALVLAGPDERARESIKAEIQGKAIEALPLFGAV